MPFKYLLREIRSEIMYKGQKIEEEIIHKHDISRNTFTTLYNKFKGRKFSNEHLPIRYDVIMVQLDNNGNLVENDDLENYCTEVGPAVYQLYIQCRNIKDPVKRDEFFISSVVKQAG